MTFVTNITKYLNVRTLKMNSSSNIQISQSSLLSLKAEVLRKQQEVNKAKILQQQQQQTQTPLREKSKSNTSQQKNEPHNKGIEDRRAYDEVEDEDLLRKSKRMLESKTRLYNRLVKGPESLTEEELERNKHYLVQFDRKEKEKQVSSDEEHFSDEYEPATNPDEEWVEYMDCLGRTRTCLRKDLEYLKGKDIEFSKTIDADRRKINEESQKFVTEKQTQEKNDNQAKSSSENFTENNELLSSDMRRELLRQEWEKQEQELMDKKDIHYQDILFNEARSHGVGYYAFSKDAEERSKQQEELNKLRQETTEKQTSTLEQKALRDKQMAARLKAARNRKRARMGLPPEEDEPEQSKPEEETHINEEEKSQIATKVAEDKAKDNERRRHIRPWDIGKEGVGKKHYEYSQEEWVEKKRKERPKEFAPPVEEKKKTYREVEDFSESGKSLYFTTKKPKHFDTSVPPPNFNSSSSTINPYRDSLKEYDINYKTFQPTPIVDELDEDSDIEEQEEHTEEVTINKRKGAEIAPPPTFDYYGPTATKNKKIEAGSSLEDSISAGLRFLREQQEKKEKSTTRRDYEDD